MEKPKKKTEAKVPQEGVPDFISDEAASPQAAEMLSTVKGLLAGVPKEVLDASRPRPDEEHCQCFNCVFANMHYNSMLVVSLGIDRQAEKREMVLVWDSDERIETIVHRLQPELPALLAEVIQRPEFYTMFQTRSAIKPALEQLKARLMAIGAEILDAKYPPETEVKA